MKFRSVRVLLSLSVFAALVLVVFAPAIAAPAAEVAPAKVSYFRDVWPIFLVQCQGCHQPAKREGEYDATNYAKLMGKSESHATVIKPGKPDESPLLKLITPENGKAQMPHGKPALSDREVALVRRWIVEGAADDTPPSANTPIDAEHPPQYRGAPVITSLAYAPDGSTLAISGYHEALLYKPDGSALVARLIGKSERLQTVAFSPDGKRLVACGGSPCRFGEVQVWDVAERKQLLSQMTTYDTIYGAAWSPDGTRLAYGGADNSVRAINAETGEQVLFQGAHNDWVLGTTFSKDSSHLISVSRDRSMKLIETATQRFVDNITSITPGALKGGLASIDRHPTKDEVAVGGADGVAKVFRIYREPGKERKIGDDNNLIRAFDPSPGRIYSVQYSPDGAFIAIGSSNNGTGEVRVVNANDGRVIAKYLDGGPIFAVAFSRDGKTVAAGGFAGDVLLIDANTGKLNSRFTPEPWTPAKLTLAK